MSVTKPLRYPNAVTTYPPRHILADFPALPNDFQVVKGEDFLPYRASDFTVTQTNGTGASFAANAGAVKLSTTGTTNADKIFLAHTQGFQFEPGNKLYFDMRMAFPTANNDVNMYAGFVDNVDPSAPATNGVYFLKPAGGSTVNLVILKGGTSTTFQNVADLAKPSGIYNDPFAATAALSFTLTGGNYASPVITSAGMGYRVAPLILLTGATGANATAIGVLGGSNVGTVPANQTVSTSLPYSSLSNVILTNVGNAAYTTVTNEIDPWINLQFYYDGKGTLYVGVNGRVVMSVGNSPANSPLVLGTGVAAGGSYNVATVGPTFNCSGTQLAATQYVIQPITGDVYNILPQNVLLPAFGFKNTTANARLMYVDEFNLCTEFN
jgi:hypothetical protein